MTDCLGLINSSFFISHFPNDDPFIWKSVHLTLLFIVVSFIYTSTIQINNSIKSKNDLWADDWLMNIFTFFFVLNKVSTRSIVLNVVVVYKNLVSLTKSQTNPFLSLYIKTNLLSLCFTKKERKNFSTFVWLSATTFFLLEKQTQKQNHNFL